MYRLSAVRGQVVTGRTDNLKLTDEQKTRLLGLGLEPIKPGCRPDPDEERGDLLCDILRCPLPVTDQLPGTAMAVPAGLGSALGPLLGQLLNDPKTDVAVLRRIKDYTKSLGGHAACEVEKDAFLAVYFAAIAAALVHHDERITGHSDKDLVKSLSFFREVQWIPVDLRRLFHVAADRSRRMEKREV